MWYEMQVVPINTGGLVKKAFEYEESLSAAGNGNAILIPDDCKTISVQTEPTGCAVKVQATIDTLNAVKTGTPVWLDWDYGEVTDNVQKKCNPVTALRLVQVGAGSSKIKVRAQ